jgi:DNA-binding response OmpR family regulator
MDHSILVVEDDEILADNICTYLKLKGFEVTVCHSAELAWSRSSGPSPTRCSPTTRCPA